MSTALINTESQVSLYERIANPLEAIERMGNFFARSGMFGCTRVEQGMVMAMACLAEKMSPFEIKRKYHLVDGNLSMRADAMLAEFHSRGGSEVWLQFDNAAAVATWTYKQNQNLRIAYTIEDAQRAGYGKWDGRQFKAGSGWAQNPAAMLRARLISAAVRMLCPEAVSGVYTPEEMQDYTPSPAPRAVTAEVLLPPTPPPVAPTASTPQEPTETSLAELLGDHAPAALAWLAAQKWLEPGQGFANLAPGRASAIRARPAAFIAKIQEAANNGN